MLVSDDASPDDSLRLIPALLESSCCRHVYFLQERNLGYDANVRFCLSEASGEYVFLLGNDDGLCQPDTLAAVVAGMRATEPDVAFTNYRLANAVDVVRRAETTMVLGDGVEAALRHFRNFSFVSGLIFRRAATAKHETSRWDRSVFRSGTSLV